MTAHIKLPINPFEDVNPSEFNKLNKKHVTEDFVEENFKLLKWNVVRPFHDTGIDRIITKVICKEGHTQLDENLSNNNGICSICEKPGVEIIRFIQVKTRTLKNNVFGFTLKSKDIRVDPRHIFLFYSDQTTSDKQDFLIISNKILYKFFSDNGLKPFASRSFRKGNNKLNSLRYEPTNDKWYWESYLWESYRNISGLKLIQDSEIDLNLISEVAETKKYADSLLKSFSGEPSIRDLVKLNLQENLEKYSDKKKIIELRKKVKSSLRDRCDSETYKSMENYFEDINFHWDEGDSE